MKRLIALALAMLMLFAFAACGDKQSATPTPTPSTAPSKAPSTQEPGDKPMRMVYICLNLGDLSFNDSGWDGVQRVAEKYGWTADVIELGKDTSTYENAFLDAADSGKYDILITQSNYGLSDLCIKYSNDYPDMKFISFDMSASADISGNKNMFGISFKQNEGSFLVGALAGKVTKTNKIGVFIFNDVPVGNDFLTGYIAGVRHANPNAEITYAYGGGTADATKLQEISSAMYDSGVDIIYGVSGSAYPGLAKEATARGGFASGVYAIGVDTDMWTVYKASQNAQYADVILTSMLKNVSDSVVYAIELMLNNELKWGTVQPFGILEGGVGVADNSHYRSNTPADVLEYMDQLQEDVVSGKVKVPSYFDFKDYDEFAAWRDK